MMKSKKHESTRHHDITNIKLVGLLKINRDKTSDGFN